MTTKFRRNFYYFYYNIPPIQIVSDIKFHCFYQTVLLETKNIGLPGNNQLCDCYNLQWSVFLVVVVVVVFSTVT